jgi:hypothetical protein
MSQCAKILAMLEKRRGQWVRLIDLAAGAEPQTFVSVSVPTEAGEVLDARSIRDAGEAREGNESLAAFGLQADSRGGHDTFETGDRVGPALTQRSESRPSKGRDAGGTPARMGHVTDAPASLHFTGELFPDAKLTGAGTY